MVSPIYVAVIGHNFGISVKYLETKLETSKSMAGPEIISLKQSRAFSLHLSTSHS